MTLERAEQRVADADTSFGNPYDPFNTGVETIAEAINRPGFMSTTRTFASVVIRFMDEADQHGDVEHLGEGLSSAQITCGAPMAGKAALFFHDNVPRSLYEISRQRVTKVPVTLDIRNHIGDGFTERSATLRRAGDQPFRAMTEQVWTDDILERRPILGLTLTVRSDVCGVATHYDAEQLDGSIERVRSQPGLIYYQLDDSFIYGIGRTQPKLYPKPQAGLEAA